ncbi:hypothetical protein [Clostridium sp.]|uniref:hypothetical protein n=1 Tax=Clostridium sp. TaxID=1506 RepID=UPI002628C631|nr:hypothetical protein [Clostridium sp.]
MINAKRIIKYIFIFILFIMLFGCGDIDLKSSTMINTDESGTVKLQIIYDDFIASKLQGDIINHKWAHDNGYLFNKYSKANMTIEEITYEFKNIKELEQIINSSGLAKMTYSKRVQVMENIYDIELRFNKSAIDRLIKSNINNDEKIYNYISNIKFRNEVTVPRSIVNSKTLGDINKNTEEWTYKLNQIDNSTTISLSYK